MTQFPHYQQHSGHQSRPGRPVEPTNAELQGYSYQYGQPYTNLQPVAGSPYGPPAHPNAVPVLVMGILSFAVGITGPIALIMGLVAYRDVKHDPQRYRSDGSLLAGTILGGVVTGVMLLGLVMMLFLIGAIATV